MKLLMPPAIAKSVPKLYSTEHLPLSEKTVHAKWFTPFSSWSWFIVEYDPSQRLAFGLVIGLENEWGYIALDEVEALRGPGGLTVERDIHFAPCTVAELVKRERISGVL